MVAVTVIIAAVVGSSAFGLGESVSETPPQAQLAVTQHGDELIWEDDNGRSAPAAPLVLEIEHAGGDDIDPTNLEVTVDGVPAYAVGPTGVDPENPGDRTVILPFQTSNPDSDTEWETVSAGDSTYIFWAATWLTDEGFDEQAEDPMNNDLKVGLWDGLSDGDNIAGINGEDNPKWGTDDGTIDSGATLRVTWESGDQSQALLEHEIS